MLIGLAWMNTYAEGLTFGVVVIGVVLGLIQWNRQLKREAAEFLKELLDELRSEEVVSFLYDIDYDKSGMEASSMRERRKTRLIEHCHSCRLCAIFDPGICSARQSLNSLNMS